MAGNAYNILLDRHDSCDCSIDITSDNINRIELGIAAMPYSF